MNPHRIVFGNHSVHELIKYRSKAIQEIHILLSHQQIDFYRRQTRQKRISLIQHVKGSELDQLIGKSVNHQGIVALAARFQYVDVVDILEKCHQQPRHSCVLLLDGITDPQNLGAIIRSSGFYGVDGILLPKDRSASVNDTVLKVASGAAEHIPIAKIPNAVRIMEAFKEARFWIVGMGDRAKKAIYEIDLVMDVLLVIGSEGKGVRRLVRENCDFWVKLPGDGQISSLNAASATSIGLYEIYRQRKIFQKSI